MRKNILVLLLITLLAGLAYLFYQHVHHREDSVVSFNPADDLGTYTYTCQDGMEFTAHFFDAQHVELRSLSSTTETPKGVLSFSTTTSGTLYRSEEVSFHGKGETVELTIGSTTTLCSPQTVPDEAPMNFGE